MNEDHALSIIPGMLSHCSAVQSKAPGALKNRQSDGLFLCVFAWGLESMLRGEYNRPMRSPITNATAHSGGRAGRPGVTDPVELAVVEVTDDYVVLDVAALQAALREIGPTAAPAVSGLVKVGFPYAAEDYGDDNFDE
jgi:hypothetical protein